MGKLIYICEICTRARATLVVRFPISGPVVHVCARCHMTDGPE